MVEITDFSAALLDLTNPDAREWIKDVIKDKIELLGVSGRMADFGEGLPDERVCGLDLTPQRFGAAP